MNRIRDLLYLTIISKPIPKPNHTPLFRSDWIMIMNTGERFGYDKNWVNLTGLINESDPRFTLANNNLKTNTAEPFRSGLIRFRHPNLKRPVFEWKMPLVVSNQLNLDFSGE